VDLGLEGRTVIITGGSGGIGHGLVIGFAREGANVVSASRDVAPGAKLAARAREQGCPGTVLPVATDVTDPSSVTAMLARAHEHFGPVDVLVNNAGGVARHCASVVQQLLVRRTERFRDLTAGVFPLVDQLFEHARVRMLRNETLAQQLEPFARDLRHDRRIVQKPPATKRHQVVELPRGDA